MIRSFNHWKKNILRHFFKFRKKQEKVQFMRIIECQLAQNCPQKVLLPPKFFCSSYVVIVAFSLGVCPDIVTIIYRIVQYTKYCVRPL